MGGHLRIFRHASATPFLDGDFLRDSSNPLDVYEDMQVTTPPPDAAQGKSAPSATPAAPDEKTEDKGTEVPGKDEGTEGDKDENKTSAVQMDKIATLRAEEEAQGLASEPTGAPARTAKKEVASDSVTPVPAVAEKEATPKASAPSVNDTKAEVLTPSASNPTKVSEEAEAEVPMIVKTHPKCMTRNDERAVSFWSQTAPVGSPCLFGVDARDEGRHCIAETEFGSNGWCYTERDMSAWGSCAKECPLSGPPGKLAKKIESVATVLSKLSEKLDTFAGPAQTAEDKIKTSE